MAQNTDIEVTAMFDIYQVLIKSKISFIIPSSLFEFTVHL